MAFVGHPYLAVIQGRLAFGHSHGHHQNLRRVGQGVFLGPSVVPMCPFHVGPTLQTLPVRKHGAPIIKGLINWEPVS